MAKFEHTSQIPVNEPADQRIEPKRDRIFNIIAKDAADSVRFEDMLMAPISEGPLFLLVNKKPVMFVGRVNGDPLHRNRPDPQPELNSRPNLQPAPPRDHTAPLPRRKKKAQNVVSLVKSEYGFDRRRESSLVDET